MVPAYICPSSPFEALLDGGFSSGADTSQRAHYTGLAGAVDDTNDGGTFVETRQRPTPGGTEPANGIISGGGLLLLNSSANIAGATDGTSNTAFIGEVSNYLLDAATPPQKVRPNQALGLCVSTNSNQEIDGSNTGSLDKSVFTLTSVRYQLNHGDGSLAGVGEGFYNNGLQSAHTGGVNVAYADGSTHFVSDTIQLNTLKNLVTRDDGNVLESF